MGFLRQDYWSRLPFPSPGDLPDPGIDSLPPKPPTKPQIPLPLPFIPTDSPVCTLDASETSTDRITSGSRVLLQDSVVQNDEIPEVPYPMGVFVRIWILGCCLLMEGQFPGGLSVCTAPSASRLGVLAPKSCLTSTDSTWHWLDKG